MLKITVLGNESFDEEKQEFVYPDSFELELEHSLVSLSKWESKFEKPFLSEGEKTTEETLGYIHAMILDPDIPEEVVYQLSDENIIAVQNYIEAKMTATWFNEVRPDPKTSEVLTAELIYYWMNSLNIPVEFETWHLNRLFTLIKIHGIKNAKPKKMSRAEAAARQKALNDKRRRELGTSG